MQTAVSDYVAGHEGARADMRPHDVVSMVCNDANGNIKPGRFVTRGATDREVVLPDATGEVSAAGLLQGVALWDPTREYIAANLGAYLETETVPVMRKGTVWMIAEDAVVDGGEVFVRFSAGAGEELGRVRSDADTADAVAAPRCYFRSTTTGANQLVKVEINLP